MLDIIKAPFLYFFYQSLVWYEFWSIFSYTGISCPLLSTHYCGDCWCNDPQIDLHMPLDLLISEIIFFIFGSEAEVGFWLPLLWNNPVLLVFRHLFKMKWTNQKTNKSNSNNTTVEFCSGHCWNKLSSEAMWDLQDRQEGNAALGSRTLYEFSKVSRFSAGWLMAWTSVSEGN